MRSAGWVSFFNLSLCAFWNGEGLCELKSFVSSCSKAFQKRGFCLADILTVPETAPNKLVRPQLPVYLLTGFHISNSKKLFQATRS
jgi:hypothetical protein